MSFVLICWTGTPKEMKQFLDLGFYISFSGIVTFPNAPELRDALAITPSDRYMVETDAPYLAPVPQRGKPNQPAWVLHVGEKMASVRGIELNQLAEESWRNASHFYGLDG